MGYFYAYRNSQEAVETLVITYILELIKRTGNSKVVPNQKFSENEKPIWNFQVEIKFDHKITVIPRLHVKKKFWKESN